MRCVADQVVPEVSKGCSAKVYGARYAVLVPELQEWCWGAEMLGFLVLESFETPDSLRTSLPLEAKNARFDVLTAAMLKIRNCWMLFRNMWNQSTYPMT